VKSDSEEGNAFSPPATTVAKYWLKMTARMVVAKAELAKSYITQPKISLFWTGIVLFKLKGALPGKKNPFQSLPEREEKGVRYALYRQTVRTSCRIKMA